jgi:hypothetical protein
MEGAAVGRSPIGETAMTGAERSRRYRLKRQGSEARRLPPVPGPDADLSEAGLARWSAELKSWIAKLELDEVAALRRVLAEADGW